MTTPSMSLASHGQSSMIQGPGDQADAGLAILRAANTIIGELNQLYTSIDGLEGEWTGSAATSYHLLQQEWNAAAAGLFGDGAAPGVLGEIAQAMNIVSENYWEAEITGISTWNHA